MELHFDHELPLSFIEVLTLRLGPLMLIAGLAAIGISLLALLFAVLERAGRIPKPANASQRSLWTDLGFVVLSPITDMLSRTLTTVGLAGCAFVIGKHMGRDLLEGFGPVIAQSRWLVVAEMLVLSDFIYYWTHRLAHTVPFLWRLHSIHHSTQHMRWTSALRAHPAEVYSHLINMLPLFLLGFPVDALAPLAPIVALYAFVIHCDVNITLRRVSWFVNTPMFHGWHHARDVKSNGTNFAGFFPVFDVIFGTYELPEHRPEAVGIHDAQMPQTWFAQLKYPFRRQRKLARIARASSKGSQGLAVQSQSVEKYAFTRS